jgi:hypothetical protein
MPDGQKITAKDLNWAWATIIWGQESSWIFILCTVSQMAGMESFFLYFIFKGIVSRDFEVFLCHLIDLKLLHLTERVRFLFKFHFHVEFFDFRVSA